MPQLLGSAYPSTSSRTKISRLLFKLIPEMSLRGMAFAFLGIASAFALYASSASANGTVIGPIVPYFGLADSPFNGVPGLQLVTFETGGLPPGVTASAGFVIGPGPLVDSVEGPGPLGHSFFSGCGSCGITFTFNAAILGQLPTSVGIVWTDGDSPTRIFQAFDASNTLIGTINDPTGLFFSTGGDGVPSNYRFYGATDPNGISSIFISNSNGGIEVDDLQFGFASTPEPATLSLLGLGALLAGAVRRRR
jgi:PEP-CTERM motif